MELIDRDKLIEILAEMQGRCATKAALVQNSKIWQQVKDMPTVEAEPVRHGHWNGVEMDSRGYTDIFECSECKCYVRTPFMMKVMEYDFCPSCGADMRGDNSERE